MFQEFFHVEAMEEKPVLLAKKEKEKPVLAEKAGKAVWLAGLISTIKLHHTTGLLANISNLNRFHGDDCEMANKSRAMC